MSIGSKTRRRGFSRGRGQPPHVLHTASKSKNRNRCLNHHHKCCSSPKFSEHLFSVLFSARRVERCTPKRPNIVKCLAVKQSAENALPWVFLALFLLPMYQSDVLGASFLFSFSSDKRSYQKTRKCRAVCVRRSRNALSRKREMLSN